MAVLAPSLRSRAVADPPEREVLRQLLPGLQVIPAADQRTLPEDDDAVWLWDSQPLQGDLVPIGECVDPERLALIPSGDPLRLLRVERNYGNGVLRQMSVLLLSPSIPLQMLRMTIDMPICCLLRVNSI